MAAKPIFVQAVDTNGAPYSGAKLNVYDAGTTTPRAIYTESGLGTASANPAIADANGVVVVWVNDAGGDIKVTLTNSAETVTPHNEDNVPIASLTCYPVITFQGDQSLLTTSSPTFAGLTLGNVSFAGVVTDPNADRLFFWDDSAGQVNFMTLGTGLAFNGTALELDGDLQDISGLTPTDGGVIIGDGTDFVVESGATLRTSIGVAIGSDVQAWDADLDVYAANPLTAAQLGELQNIGTTTISPAQWGYVGSQDQALTTTDSPTFATVTSTSSVINGVTVSPSGATLGQALGFPNSTSTLEPYTPAGGGDLLAALNLSDVDDAATARGNLAVPAYADTAPDAATAAATMSDGDRILTGARSTAGDGGGALWELDSNLGDVSGDASITAGTYTPTMQTFNASTGVSGSTITFGSAHGFAVGDYIWYSSEGGTKISELTEDGRYYVLASGFTTTTIQIGLSPSGSAIALSAGSSENHGFQEANEIGRVRLVDVTDVGGSGTGAKAYVITDDATVFGAHGTIAKAWIDPKNPGSGYSGTPTADLSAFTDISGASVTFALADNGSRIAVASSVARLKNVTEYGYVDKCFGVSASESDNHDNVQRMLRAAERDGIRCVSTVDTQIQHPIWTRGGHEWHFEQGARIHNNYTGGRFPENHGSFIGNMTGSGLAYDETQNGESARNVSDENWDRYNLSSVDADRNLVTTTTAADAGNFAVGDACYVISRGAGAGDSDGTQYKPFKLALNIVDSVDAGTGAVGLKYPITFDPEADSFDIVNGEISPYVRPTAPKGSYSYVPYFTTKDLNITGAGYFKSDRFSPLGGGGYINCKLELDRIEGRDGVFHNTAAFSRIDVKTVVAAGKMWELAVGSHDTTTYINQYIYDEGIVTAKNTDAPLIHASEHSRNMTLYCASADWSDNPDTTATRCLWVPYTRDGRFEIGTLRAPAFTGNLVDIIHSAITQSDNATVVGRPTVNNDVILHSVECDAPSRYIRIENESASGNASVDRNRVKVVCPNSTPSNDSIRLGDVSDVVVYDSYLPSGGLSRDGSDETMRVINSYWPEATSLTAAERDDISCVGVQTASNGLDYFNGGEAFFTSVETDLLTTASGATHILDGTVQISGTLTGSGGIISLSGYQLRRNSDTDFLSFKGGTGAAGTGASMSMYGADNASSAAGDFILDSVYGGTTTPNSEGKYRFRFYDLDTSSFSEWGVFTPAGSAASPRGTWAMGATINLTNSGRYQIGGTQVVGPQGATISDPSGGATVDSEARTAINTIIDRLQAHGLIA